MIPQNRSIPAHEVYKKCEELISYVNDRNEYVKRLEEIFSHITTEATILNSSKERLLKISETKEMSNEYPMLITEIDIVHKMHAKFLSDYEKATGRRRITRKQSRQGMEASTTSIWSPDKIKLLRLPLDVSLSRTVVDFVQSLKPSKVKTVENLSEDVTQLYAYTYLVNKRLEQEITMLEKDAEVDMGQSTEEEFDDIPQEIMNAKVDMGQSSKEEFRTLPHMISGMNLALSKPDAMKLFESIYGEIEDMGIRKIMEEILERCECHPLAVKLLATNMKGEINEKVWKQIHKSKKTGVNYASRVAYDLLDDKLKKCFLYGTLFPKWQEIDKDYLIECWYAEGLLDNFDDDSHALRAARDHGETVLKQLTSQCLFKSCSDDDSGENVKVKMPDYSRAIASEALNEFPDGVEGEFWSTEKGVLPVGGIWMKKKRISFTGYGIDEQQLPECPESKSLSVLMVHGRNLRKLPELFFLNMEKLTILNLGETAIESLPHSISKLRNLVSLHMNGCWLLKSLPPEVKELQKLELVDIYGTLIRQLPHEIRSLASLRCLRVPHKQKFEIKDAEIIGNLKKLEELIIEASEFLFEVGDEEKMIDAMVELEQLTTLHFHFTRADNLARFVGLSKSWNNHDTPWRKNTFRSFRFTVGTSVNRKIMAGGERHLIFSSDEEISVIYEAIKQASTFELIFNSNVKTLICESHLEEWGALQVCMLKSCSRLLGVIEESAGVILQSLVELHLDDLKSLQYIWKGKAIPNRRTLSNLTILTISDCPELTEILTPTLSKNLSSLEKLHVENCSKVVKIIGEQMHQLEGQPSISQIVDVNVLHRLKNIKLVNLPELQSICDNTSLSWKSLKRIGIIRCRKLWNLSLTPGNARKLSTISCEESWWNDKHLQLDKQHFSHLCHFIQQRDSLDHGYHFLRRTPDY